MRAKFVTVAFRCEIVMFRVSEGYTNIHTYHYIYLVLLFDVAWLYLFSYLA